MGSIPWFLFLLLYWSVYRNAIDFCALILYSAILLNSYSKKSTNLFCWRLLGFLHRVSCRLRSIKVWFLLCQFGRLLFFLLSDAEGRTSSTKTSWAFKLILALASWRAQTNTQCLSSSTPLINISSGPYCHYLFLWQLKYGLCSEKYNWIPIPEPFPLPARPSSWYLDAPGLWNGGRGHWHHPGSWSHFLMLGEPWAHCLAHAPLSATDCSLLVLSFPTLDPSLLNSNLLIAQALLPSLSPSAWQPAFSEWSPSGLAVSDSSLWMALGRGQVGGARCCFTDSCVPPAGPWVTLGLPLAPWDNDNNSHFVYVIGLYH